MARTLTAGRSARNVGEPEVGLGVPTGTLEAPSPDLCPPESVDGLLGALLATGSDLLDGVVEAIKASNSALATLAAARPHCPTRADLLQMCAAIAITGVDDQGVATFLAQEGIHPLSVRLLAASRYGLMARVEPNDPKGRDEVVARLDRTLAIPVRFRIEPSALVDYKADLKDGFLPIQELPDGLLMTTTLDLSTAKALERTPIRLSTIHDLRLRDCWNLNALGDDLQVARDLDLQNCRSLKSLPKGLVVGGTLDLRGCVEWDGQVPEDAVVGKGILFAGTQTRMSLTAYRKFQSVQSALGQGGRAEWDAIMASGAGVRNAVATLSDREDPVNLATWALELVQEVPWEVMRGIQSLIHGRRN